MVGVWEHLRTMMIVSSKLGQSKKNIPLTTWWPGDWPAIAVTCALCSQSWSQHLKPIPAARICVVASNFPHDDGFQDSLSSVFKFWIFRSSHFSPCGRTLWRSKEDHRTTRLWPFSRGTAPKSRRRRKTSQCPFIAACATTLVDTGRIPEIYHQGKRCCYLNGYKTGEPSLPLRYWDSASSLQPAWFRNGQVIIEFWHICICSGLVNGWGPMWLTGLIWIHLEFQQSLHLTHGWKWFFLRVLQSSLVRQHLVIWSIMNPNSRILGGKCDKMYDHVPSLRTGFNPTHPRFEVEKVRHGQDKSGFLRLKWHGSCVEKFTFSTR